MNKLFRSLVASAARKIPKTRFGRASGVVDDATTKPYQFGQAFDEQVARAKARVDGNLSARQARVRDIKARQQSKTPFYRKAATELSARAQTNPLLTLAGAGGLGAIGYNLYSDRFNNSNLPEFDPSYRQDLGLQDMQDMYDQYMGPQSEALERLLADQSYEQDINRNLEEGLAMLRGYGQAIVPATGDLYAENAGQLGERAAFEQALGRMTGEEISNMAGETAANIEAAYASPEYGGEFWGTMPLSGDLSDIPADVVAQANINAGLATDIGAIDARGTRANQQMLQQLGPLAAAEVRNRLALQESALRQMAGQSIAEDNRARRMMAAEGQMGLAGERGRFLMEQAIAERQLRQQLDNEVRRIVSDPASLRELQREYLANATQLARVGIESFTEYVYAKAESSIGLA